MPNWTRVAVGAWTERAGIGDGRVFHSPRKRDGAAPGVGLSTRAIADMVAARAVPLGIDVAPHECRCTFAKLAFLTAARGWNKSQLSLGHASIRTTERYLGVEQDLTDAPCDRLGLRLS
jgi:integrase